MRPFLPSILLALLAPAALAAPGDFDHDAEGWRTCDFDTDLGVASDFAPAVWSSAHGGSLATGDVATWCFFAAPAALLGNQSSAMGGHLAYQTYSTLDDGVAYPAAILQSSTTVLYNLAPPPGATWKDAALPLRGSAWSLSPDEGGAAVTDAQLASVLSDLKGVYIEADWYFGTGETTGLDRVRLQAVPEPAPLAVLALGGLGLVRRRGRARRSVGSPR